MPCAKVFVFAAVILWIMPTTGWSTDAVKFHMRSGEKKTCTPEENPCPVTLKVHFRRIEDLGTIRYCLIEAPTVELKLSSVFPEIKIIWTLDVQTPLPANDVEFMDNDTGIKIFGEPHGHIAANRRGRGDGGVGGTDIKKFHLHAQYQNVAKEAVYLPMVIHRDGAGEPAFCAAVDPKIINTP
jgi:hypothetical protein